MEIIPRSEWGAIHPRGFKEAPLPASEVWLHHSVTIAPDLIPPFDDDYAAVRTLERIGQQRFNGGISYTFAVTPVGLVFEGHGIDRQGAHTGGRNSIARAICLIGDYSTKAPTTAMKKAVAELLVHGFKQKWWKAPKLNGGHRDAPGASTACPGNAAHKVIGEINTLAADLAKTQSDVIKAPTTRRDNMLDTIDIPPGNGERRFILPTGGSAIVTERCWFSAAVNGPATGKIRLWCQSTTKGLNDTGGWKTITFKDGISSIFGWELPSGTAQVNVQWEFPNGGTFTIEGLARG